MNNNRLATINMSLLPLAIIILLIIGAGYFLLQGDIKLPKFGKGPKITRIEGFPTVVSVNKDLEKQRKIIKSETELNDFLNSIDSTGQLTIPTKIDFNKNMVIAVATDTNEETGTKIKIRKVYENKENKTYQISIEESEKGQYCEIEKEKNVAVDLAIISKTDWNIQFDRSKKVENCEKPETETTSSNNNTVESAETTK